MVFNILPDWHWDKISNGMSGSDAFTNLSCGDVNSRYCKVLDTVSKIQGNFVQTVVRSSGCDEATDVENLIIILPDLEVDE